MSTVHNQAAALRKTPAAAARARRFADRPVFRLLVTGSRDWADVAMLHEALDVVLAEVERKQMRLLVVHGACPSGADTLAELWVRRRNLDLRPVDSDPCPADWRRHGKRAGVIRNGQMVAAGADRCLAFFAPGAENKGTRHCVEQARAYGIPVTRYPAPQQQDTLF